MNSSGSVFKDLPSRYDTIQKQCLPNWETFFSTVIEFIPRTIPGPGSRLTPESAPKSITGSVPKERESKNPKIEILELGSGSGVLTSLIRKERPDARITCIDRDPEMLAVAKEKPEMQENLTFIEGDIIEECEKWKEETEEIGKFDIVLSTQCLCFLPRDAKARVFRKIYEALKPDGRFIEGDIFRPGNELEEGIYRAHWKSYMLEHGLTAKETEEMLETFNDIRERIDTLEKFRERLKEAGFKEVFCPYWYEMYAVFVACK